MGQLALGKTLHALDGSGLRSELVVAKLFLFNLWGVHVAVLVRITLLKLGVRIYIGFV